MTSPYIRPVSRGDIQAIAELEQTCFREPWPPVAFAQFADAHGFLVAVSPASTTASSSLPVDGDLIGYIVTTPATADPATTAHVRNLAVDPDHRRQGIASRLLRTAIARYRDEGYERVRLEVRASNESAIELYHAHHFAVSGRIPEYYADDEAALVMERSIDEPDG